MRSGCSSIMILLAFLVIGAFEFESGFATTVTYDHRALVIDGQRHVLLSGSIHYPRTTPEVWSDIIRKSKEGGLDVIETYVFWNYHEPVRGQYYFEGRFDLVRFVKVVQKAGLFVHLRIGPYACAEWNYGGFPLWLHFIPGIQFRTSNTPFKNEMERFLTMIVDMMKEEKLFASQGGPIILAQVENEYGNVEWAYGVGGELYVTWAASMAVSLNTTVPWIMCQQADAPDPVINTCNGFYCDGFTPNSPSKPAMWTENYCGWFLAFGYAVPYRPVEDLAFSVARFFERGGTFQNYYMYFGGTNFGRTAGGPLVATSYDYDAPIDEYGFIREPKWSHLRDLHKAIKNCERPLVASDPTYMSLGANLEAHVYNNSEGCAAFLANIDNNSDANVSFHGNLYRLPAWSVSILPDCKNVIFNTAKNGISHYILEWLIRVLQSSFKVVSQKAFGGSSYKNKMNVEYNIASSAWYWYEEHVGFRSDSSFTQPGLLEQINTTKDASDYLWYSQSIDVNDELPQGKEEAVLHIESLVMQHLSLLTKGLQNYGPWFDVAGAGIYSVAISDLVKGKVDLSTREWTYQVQKVNTLDSIKSLANNSIWKSGINLPINQSLIWYKTTFTAPEGDGPLSLNLASMGKGQAWVNGQGIGRYWSAYLSPKEGCSDHCDYRGSYDSNKCLKNCGQPAQTLYHVPRSWVEDSGENLLVLHEELGGDPSKITVSTKSGHGVCAHISESDHPPIDLWEPGSGFNQASPEVQLSCDNEWKIISINFVSFGTPTGQCGKFSHGNCSAHNAIQIIQEINILRSQPITCNEKSTSTQRASTPKVQTQCVFIKAKS
ncbi:Beta-galactosidase 8 [Acorus calamus]|uniref:Beta-galactosidase n=1 Tax=Acorus calamus TaxID=4465 RepID=A0AAV9E8F1_ACOCL|nr:Beta-galactosidase 8 [Acorus calamus]